LPFDQVQTEELENNIYWWKQGVFIMVILIGTFAF